MTHHIYHPETEEPIYIDYTETGFYRPATCIDPPEYPEIEVDAIYDEYGREIETEDLGVGIDDLVRAIEEGREFV